MTVYVGLDLSQYETSICIIDADGAIIEETTAATEPDAIIAALASHRGAAKRIGLEACPLAEWLFEGLSAAGWPVVCLESRRLKAALSGAINKTDRNDARGIAQVARIGLYRSVHVKSRRSQELRFLLKARKSVLDRIQDAENELRSMLKTFGLRIGPTTRRSFADRVRTLLADQPALKTVAATLLKVRATLRAAFDKLHRMVLSVVREDEACRRFMTVPGVGPITALTFTTTVDAPARFTRARSIGAYLGMTPRIYQSGEIARSGRISKIGDRDARTALFEAANALLTRTKRWSKLKAWGMRVAKRSCLKVAKVAVARKLAALLLSMWRERTTYNWANAA